METFGSVSYTHLDVYKRQLLYKAESVTSNSAVFSILEDVTIGSGIVLKERKYLEIISNFANPSIVTTPITT